MMVSNIRCNTTNACSSPHGTVVPHRGDTRHLPARMRGWWTPLASVHTTYSTTHRATMEESPKPTKRGEPTASSGFVDLGKAASAGTRRLRNHAAQRTFSWAGMSESQPPTASAPYRLLSRSFPWIRAGLISPKGSYMPITMLRA